MEVMTYQSAYPIAGLSNLFKLRRPGDLLLTWINFNLSMDK